MTQALSEPDSISKLIVVDISPAKGAISPEFRRYITGMREVDEAEVESKKEGDKMLQSYEEVCTILCNSNVYNGGLTLSPSAESPNSAVLAYQSDERP